MTIRGILDVLTRTDDGLLLACDAPLGSVRVSNASGSERGIFMRKGLRFDIFRRDAFTCRYCGAQPPAVVLEVDHVVPRVDGGTDDTLNLVTSCGDCNRGKSRKRLDLTSPVQPDADVEYLAVQQEIAEIEQYQIALAAKQEAIQRLISTMQRIWMESAPDINFVAPFDEVRAWLNQYTPQQVEYAIRNVAPKIAGGYLDSWKWRAYFHAVIRNMAEDR